MSIKQTNVLLLLNKVKELFGSLPVETKKGEKFIQAGKALEKLDQILGGTNEQNPLLACRKGYPAIPPGGSELIACKDDIRVIPL
jgi:hypothetical protein